MIRSTLLATAATLAFATASLAGSAKKDIVDTAVGAGSFTTLVAAVQAAGLVDTLKGDGPFTVFAPTDEAFAALPAGTVENLLQPENIDHFTVWVLGVAPPTRRDQATICPSPAISSHTRPGRYRASARPPLSVIRCSQPLSNSARTSG